jgi:hypothetical protein
MVVVATADGQRRVVVVVVERQRVVATADGQRMVVVLPSVPVDRKDLGRKRTFAARVDAPPLAEKPSIDG